MIAVIDYKAGNSPSVMHAARRLGLDAVLAGNVADIERASHIILPGVGSAGATMQSLRDTGLLGAIEKAVLEKGVFFLGICVGLQILFEHSEEDNADCLGWLNGGVVRFSDTDMRIPQMGWNEVRFVEDAPAAASDGYYYFVNSYHAVPADPSDIWALTDYGGQFASAVHRGNIYAVQFHAEKSGEAGLSLLKNFCNL